MLLQLPSRQFGVVQHSGGGQRHTRRILVPPVKIYSSNGVGIFKTDVLVLDATNILSRASSDAKQIQGASLRSCFEDWVVFLLAATAPQFFVAIFDNPGHHHTQQGSNDGDYLRRRRQRQQNNDDHISRNAAKLKPFLEVTRRHCGISLIAEGGHEADAVIGAACTLLRQQHHHHHHQNNNAANNIDFSLSIASGDSDMQQYIASATDTSWLEIVPFPTVTAPFGVQRITETDFLNAHGFLPSSYCDYLSITGKKVNASVGGVGIGASVAAKLMKQYKSVEGVEAAAKKGVLKGWPAAVEAAVTSGTPQNAQLCRNRQIFSPEIDPGVVLTKQQRHALVSLFAIEEPSSSSSSSKPTRFHEQMEAEKNHGLEESTTTTTTAAVTVNAGELIWKHPMHATRWRAETHFYVEKLVQRLAQHGTQFPESSMTMHACTGQKIDLPVDLIISMQQDGGGGGGIVRDVGVVVCTPCDFTSPPSLGDIENWNFEEVVAAVERHRLEREEENSNSTTQRRGGGSIVDPFRVISRLRRARQHHLSLLKKAGNVPVVVVPWQAFHSDAKL